MNDHPELPSTPATAKPKPQVSIGMPVYNGAKFIREALDSLLAQTFIDFELIISDNASTDGTEAICREYAAEDQRIRYVRQAQNLGAAANFKYVLDEAVGEYFMWAAHDDRRHPIALKRMIETFNENSDAGLVFSNMYSMDLNTGIKAQSTVSGISPTMKKLYKYIIRLLNGCPSLIYGLHRISVLRTVRLENYDYFDVYLSHWYELNSVVYIVPLNLYTAGTDGERIPYSLTDSRLNYKAYLSREKKLLRQHFGLIAAFVLYIAAAYLIHKNTRFLQKTYGI